MCHYWNLPVILLYRKRNKIKQNVETPVVSSAPPYENTAVYSIDENGNNVTSTVDDNRKLKPDYDNVVIVGDGVRYTTVDKLKSKKCDSVDGNLKDETIMHENDDLYADGDIKDYSNEIQKATGPDDKCSRHEQDKIIKSQKNDDECENEYEINLDRNGAIADNGSVIMHENNELYSSSVDADDAKEIDAEKWQK